MIVIQSDASWPQPTDYGSLGSWLTAVRRRRGLSQVRQAERIGVAQNTLSRWETDRIRPRLQSLCGLRDVIRMPSKLVEDAVDESMPDDRSSVFWGFIRAAVGSSHERGARDRIVEEHRDIARSTARRFHCYAEFDDLYQMALLGMANAIPSYLPMVGPFAPYARAWCRGSILGYLSDRYYEGVPRLLRPRFTAVRRTIQRLYQEHGREPTDEALMRELGLTARQVGEARGFLSRRHVSLDADKPGSTRTRHDIVGRTQADYVHTELIADVHRYLKEMPDAATLVISHVLADEPLEMVAARMGLSIEAAQACLQRALPLLRPLWPSGE